MASFLIAIAILVGIGMSYAGSKEKRRQRAAWLAAGRRIGLDPVGQDQETRAMWGQVNGQLVRAELIGKDSALSGTLSVGPVEPSLVIKPETFAIDLGKAVLGPDLECGDSVFDDAIFVQSGDPNQAFAALDHSTRRTIEHAVVTQKIVVRDGVASYSGKDILTEAGFADVLRSAQDLVRRLHIEPEMVPGRLLQLIEKDPSARVRTRALATLVADFRFTPQADQAIELVGGRDRLELLFLEHLEERTTGQTVVLKALAKVGTLACVERLMKLKCAGTMEAQRGATVDVIQKHSGAGEQGWIALAPDAPSEGALSTADDAGALAIAKREKGSG